MLLVALLVLAGLLGPAHAQSPIEVSANKASVNFGTALRFTLEAKSTSPIQEVILLVRVDGGPLVRRIYPRFSPGTTLRLNYDEELEGGQFAPGTHFDYWWSLSTADGGALRTPEQPLEYVDGNIQWEALQGERVTYYWHGREGDKARQLLKRAEEVVKRLETEIGVPPKGQITIYAYNNYNEMRRALARRSEGYDNQVTTLGVSMGKGRLVLLASHRDVNQTIAHELSHVMVDIATDNPYTELPSWLNEGLSMVAEGELRTANREALEKAIREDKLISVRSLSSYSGHASQVSLFYAEAYSVVNFLLKSYGRDKLNALLTVFAEGTLQEEALQRVYGFGVDELDTRWRASLGLKPRQRRVPKSQPTGLGPRPSQLSMGEGFPTLSPWERAG